MADEFYEKGGRLYRKKFLFDEDLGEFRDNLGGTSSVKDFFGNVIAQRAEPGFFSEPEGTVGGRDGIFQRPRLLDDGKSFFLPSTQSASEEPSPPASSASPVREGTETSSSYESTSDSLFARFLGAIGRVIIGLIAAAVTQAISLIVMALIMGGGPLIGTPAVIFAIGWWSPPVIVFLLVTGVIGRPRPRQL